MGEGVRRMEWGRVAGLAMVACVTGACGGDDQPSQVDAAVSVCGNGVIESGEDCEPSLDVNCSAECVYACGNGVVDDDEHCDTEIDPGEVGACVTDAVECADSDICTSDLLVGTECGAHCENQVIDGFKDGDGCCPDIENNTAYYDLDCAPTCGNDLVEMGERCDTSIAAGTPGACPGESGDCDDNEPCTDDAVVVPPEAGACGAYCEYTERTTVEQGDGCCPAGATFSTDDDCVEDTWCGNGVRNGGRGETCDIAIVAGNPGACPTECASDDPCTTQILLSAGTCKAKCWEIPVVDPIPGDGCCPVFEGANIRNDDDCTSSCGTTAEECDTPGEGFCDIDCRILRTGFRVIAIELKDPHIYFLIGNNCPDLTDIANNNSFPDAINRDANGDGYADLGLMNSFKPLDQSQPTNAMDLVSANCLPGVNPWATECTSDPLSDRIPLTVTNQETGLCLDVLEGTLTEAYATPPVLPSGPCFVSNSFTGDLALGSLIVPLQEAYVAATYAGGDPATGLVDGVIRGFLTEEAAQAAVIPDTVALLGGRTLYEVLAGGIQLACDIGGGVLIGDDRDVGPDSVTMGWYFYVNFTAAVVPFEDKPFASE